MAEDQTNNFENEFYTYLKKALVNPQLLKVDTGELKRIFVKLRLLNDPIVTHEILMEIRGYVNDKSISALNINAAIEEIERGLGSISGMNQAARMKIVHEIDGNGTFKKRKKSGMGQRDFLKVKMYE